MAFHLAIYFEAARQARLNGSRRRDRKLSHLGGAKSDNLNEQLSERKRKEGTHKRLKKNENGSFFC